MKNKWLFVFAIFLPVFLNASDNVQTDIVPRTVNFLIFAAVIYYLLADKLKSFFNERTQSIQNQLDEVQRKLDESKKKIDFAKAELENAKLIANDLVKDAVADVVTIKGKISKSYENDIANLLKSYNDKIELEARKTKKEIVGELLEELLSDNNMVISNDNLQNIILKKVA